MTEAESLALKRHDGVLVTPAWLAGHLYDPGLRVVEVEVGRAAYDDWHIDGAVLWDVYKDLKDDEYRLIDKAKVQRLVERSGIRPDTTVVFYGYVASAGCVALDALGACQYPGAGLLTGPLASRGPPLEQSTRAANDVHLRPGRRAPAHPR